MTRYIQSGLGAKPTKGKEKPREIPKAGSYTSKDLQAPGVKSGVWERKDG